MPMSRLLYQSRSRLKDGPLAIDAQVRQIAAASAGRNHAAGITGALLHVDDQFIQVLEGEPLAVETLFERICCDFNHSHIRLIDLVPVKERLFGEWGMAVLSAQHETQLALRGDLEHIRFMVGVNARFAVEQMRECLGFHRVDADAQAPLPA